MAPILLVWAAFDLPPIFLAMTVTPREQCEMRAAIETGDIRKVDAFIDRAPWRLNAPVFAGRQSLLSMSAGLLWPSEGPPRVAEHLRKRGARVDMWSACRMGWVDDIRRIAKADRDSLTRRMYDNTHLTVAIRYRHRSAVQVLLELGSPLSHPDDPEWCDALSDAVDSDDLEIVRMILPRLTASELDRVWERALLSACRRIPAERDTTTIVRLLLTRRPGPAAREWDKGQCLREACLAGNVGTVKLLLAAGAKPDGSSPPDPERFFGRWTEFIDDLSRLLVAANPMPGPGEDVAPPVNQEDVDAGLRQVLVRVGRLLPFFNGASVLTDAEEDGGLPPIHLASVSDRIQFDRVRMEIAELLVGAGAEWTFPAAVALGRTDLVKAFLAADPKLAKTPIYRCEFYANYWGNGPRSYHRQLLPEYVFKDEDVYPLEAAAERGDLEMVRLLLPLEQPVLREGKYPVVIKALRWAVVGGHLAMVQAILGTRQYTDVIKAHLDVFYPVAGTAGSVPVLEALVAFQAPTVAQANAVIRGAATSGRLAVAQRASSLGGSAIAKGPKGESALYVAAENSQAEMLQWLLNEPTIRSWDADVLAVALNWAAQKDSARCVEIMLKAKADPNHADATGRTAIMCAASRDAINAIRTLVRGGAEVRHADVNGETPLHVAAEQGCVRAVEQLLQLGADPAAKNARGKTTLEMVQAQLERENAIYAMLLKVEAVLKDPPAKK